MAAITDQPSCISAQRLRSPTPTRPRRKLDNAKTQPRLFWGGDLPNGVCGSVRLAKKITMPSPGGTPRTTDVACLARLPFPETAERGELNYRSATCCFCSSSDSIPLWPPERFLTTGDPSGHISHEWPVLAQAERGRRVLLEEASHPRRFGQAAQGGGKKKMLDAQCTTLRWPSARYLRPRVSKEPSLCG